MKIKNFYDLSELIAEFNIIISLYLYSRQDKLTLPEIGTSIIINNSLHPLLDRNKRIGNNVYSSSRLNLNVITGFNMSGKTIYAKSIAINIILGQIGCAIKAEYAKIKIFNAILTRLKHDENIEEKLSTYEKEITDIKNIIKMATEYTLIIIDELGRGTSYYNGATMGLVAY